MKFLCRTENVLDTYVANKFYAPIRSFMARYPEAAIARLEKSINEPFVARFFHYLISGEDGAPFRSVMYENPAKIISVMKSQAFLLGKC